MSALIAVLVIVAVVPLLAALARRRMRSEGATFVLSVKLGELQRDIDRMAVQLGLALLPSVAALVRALDGMAAGVPLPDPKDGNE